MALLKEKISELTTSESIIAADCLFTGNLVVKGSIKIEGGVEGNITDAREVFISKTARISGDISCERCIIYGSVKGNLFVNGLLEVMSTGSIEGDITASKIMVEEGASINGKIEMKS